MTGLTGREAAALREALDDEYRALATYDQVIDDFGPVHPFVNIREAEARHIAALSRLFEKYGLDLPRNAWPGKVPRFASVAEACRVGVAEEIENARLYDRLLADVQRADVKAVFRRLQEASQLRHLAAFERCLARGPRKAVGGSPATTRDIDAAPARLRRRRRTRVH
jgi:hypothetical protein